MVLDRADWGDKVPFISFESTNGYLLWAEVRTNKREGIRGSWTMVMVIVLVVPSRWPGLLA